MRECARCAFLTLQQAMASSRKSGGQSPTICWKASTSRPKSWTKTPTKLHIVYIYITDLFYLEHFNWNTTVSWSQLLYYETATRGRNSLVISSKAFSVGFLTLLLCPKSILIVYSMQVKFYVCRYSVCAKKEGCTIRVQIDVKQILSAIAWSKTVLYVHCLSGII